MGTIPSIWRQRSGLQIHSEGDRFVFQFDREANRNKVLHSGPCIYQNAMLVTVPYDGISAVVNPPLHSIETWVSILGLQHLLRNKKSLQLIGQSIVHGEPPKSFVKDMYNFHFLVADFSNFKVNVYLENKTLMTLCPNLSSAKETKVLGLKMNAIDGCWRWNPNWRSNRQQLAMCSVGFAGKMSNNIGKDVVNYEVTDPSDNALNPQPGTLRYGATMIKDKKWITFQRDMKIKLEKPLLISSFTAIDGRGVNVHIAGNACLRVLKATNVIIHGLRIHHCKSQPPSTVMGPDGIVSLGGVDGDAIRLVTASKVWIDHNTLYECEDGLLDVTRGSTNVTISNNWFRDQDKVMLLGHDDGFFRDKNMKVTVVYNHFGRAYSAHPGAPRTRKLNGAPGN
ncbi:hypothetical protein ACLB2K_045364 [Fragaria x ananassa]